MMGELSHLHDVHPLPIINNIDHIAYSKELTDMEDFQEDFRVQAVGLVD